MNDIRLSNTEFEQFYKDVLQPELEKCEELKRKLRKDNRIIAASTAVFMALAATLVSSMDFDGVWGVFAVLGYILYIALSKSFVVDNRQKQASDIYKRQIYLQAFRFYYPKTRFLANKRFGLPTFWKSLLFHPKPTTHEGEDFIVVEIGNTILQFHEASLYIGSARGSKSPVFKGLFCVATFNKEFSGQTLVLSKKGMSMRHSMNMKYHSLLHNDAFVNLESSEFVEKYHVLTDDQIEARYILSPSMMQRMLDYQQKFSTGVSFSFYKSHMFMKIPVEENLFDIRLQSRENRKTIIQRHLSYFLAITDIVEDLRLNDQIWSK